MRTRLLIPALAAALVLSACDTEEKNQASTDQAIRSILTNVMSPQYVGVSVDPVVDCIIENSSEAERIAILDTTLDFGVTGAVAATVRRIENRPGTQSCIAAKGVVKPRLGDF